MRVALWILSAPVLVSGLATVLHAGQPSQTPALTRYWDAHGGYHARVYMGTYYRWPYNHRLRADLPWYAGPSREHWPIPAPRPAFCDPGATLIDTPYQ